MPDPMLRALHTLPGFSSSEVEFQGENSGSERQSCMSKVSSVGGLKS